MVLWEVLPDFCPTSLHEKRTLKHLGKRHASSHVTLTRCGTEMNNVSLTLFKSMPRHSRVVTRRLRSAALLLLQVIITSEGWLTNV